MLIAWSARKLASYIRRKAEISNEDKDYNLFERKISLGMIYISLGLLLTGTVMMTGLFTEILTSLVTLIVIRTISGGNHFSSPDACLFTTFSAIIIVPMTYTFVPNYLTIYIFVITFVVYLCCSCSRYERNEVRIKLLVVLLVFSYITVPISLLVFSLLIPDQFIYKK